MRSQSLIQMLYFGCDARRKFLLDLFHRQGMCLRRMLFITDCPSQHV